MRLLLLVIVVLLVVIPAVEIATFIAVGGRIGALPTVLLTLFTAALGIWLVRLQGVLTLHEMGRQLAQGSVPAREIVSGMLLGLAGILLLVPGFVTDAIGLLLLITPLRRLLAGILARRPAVSGHGMSGGGNMRMQAEIIEVEVREVRDAAAGRDDPADDADAAGNTPPRRLPPR